jgi:hypothetical protein
MNKPKEPKSATSAVKRWEHLFPAPNKRNYFMTLFFSMLAALAGSIFPELDITAGMITWAVWWGIIHIYHSRNKKTD